ncbi:nucleoside/nucleotide kinase family protein [Nonomuraea gerenzanensis]|uniref:Pantothenate kinase n=1 Tax=Nonomuraea gerenzanensis TaxID=93944 RepID=A0A1M4EI16_9ACTN|nr:nucleoside/nucleotide kinase family protein [Nonomuraea gerenzanensis]UBU10219.1 nucleoside/nucleotide kinase family protein [Nonomuraea gerenzanensis]SBO98597.1 Pantothenate kinase [Nonomuraea gerenzanensis]
MSGGAGLVERVRKLATGGGRVLIGVAGCPGAGKSTLAGWLATALTADGLPAVWVPMDGFHLADVALERLGRLGRKGAVDTFDGHGYLALLRRLRAETGTVVYAPSFDRDLEQPIAGAIAVPPQARVVVSEGNYLLCPEEPWRRVRAAMTEVWYADLDDRVRLERLTRRHVEFGKSPEHAARWVAEVDEPNAAAIRATRPRADLLVDVDALALRP